MSQLTPISDLRAELPSSQLEQHLCVVIYAGAVARDHALAQAAVRLQKEGEEPALCRGSQRAQWTPAVTNGSQQNRTSNKPQATSDGSTLLLI